MSTDKPSFPPPNDPSNPDGSSHSPADPPPFTPPAPQPVYGPPPASGPYAQGQSGPGVSYGPPMPAGPAGYGPGQPTGDSDKTFLVTWLLSLLVGVFGVDRFYLGKVGTGLAKLFTFGGCGIWYLVDLILVLANAQKDKYGRSLAGYDQYKKIAWIVTGVVLAISAVTSAVQGPSQLDSNATVVNSAPTQDAPAQPDEPADEPAAEETPAEDVVEAPAADLGTRENPYPIGSAVTLEDFEGPQWEVTLGAPTFNAGDAVAAANTFNEPAPEGFQYVVVPVTVKRLAADAEAPWVGVSLKYVTAEGTTHTSGDTMSVAPAPTFNDINELYQGASGTGNEVIAIPVADTGNGTWAVSSMFGDDIFIAAK